MKKIRTLVQRKSKKKYPQTSTVEGQFESRPFPSPTEASPEQVPGVQAESEGKKRQGFNFANIDIFPPEESETPGVQPTIQRQGGDRDESEAELIQPDTTRWLETLKRERVADLFRTPGGLDGHVQQIQIEINRLISERNRRKLEGQTGEEVTQYTTALNTLRNSLIASAKAAEFDFAKFGITFAPLGSDLYLECDQGQVKVDGKPV